MLHATEVIKRPLVTEKGTFAMNEQNRYSFEVNPKATKTDIKAAIEAIYKVKVEKINTQVRKGVFRRMKYGLTQMPTTKTAVVRLKEGSAIELF
ncbi:MAG: 50S ribosomal protein L23 [Phycisphaerales bacterium]|nr:50S ribosomal protein L23 [Phycisphaerales bacterium]